MALLGLPPPTTPKRYTKRYGSYNAAHLKAHRGDHVVYKRDDGRVVFIEAGVTAADLDAPGSYVILDGPDFRAEHGRQRRLRRQHAATLADEAAATRDNAIVRREDAATRRDAAAADAIAAITRRIEQGDLDKAELDALTAALKALKE